MHGGLNAKENVEDLVRNCGARGAAQYLQTLSWEHFPGILWSLERQYSFVEDEKAPWENCPRALRFRSYRHSRQVLVCICPQKAKVAQVVANDDSLSSSEEEVQPKKAIAKPVSTASKKKTAPVPPPSSSDDSSDEDQPSATVVKKAAAAKAKTSGKGVAAKAQSRAQDSSESSSSEDDARTLCPLPCFALLTSNVKWRSASKA